MATSTARIMMLSVFLTTLPLSKQTSGISQGFFLPDKNILGTDFTEGSSIFDGIQESCFESHPDTILKEKTHYFRTASEFHDVLEYLVKVGGTYVGKGTMKGTVGVVGKIFSSKTSTMSGILLRQQHLTKYTRMAHDCMSNTPLSENLLKDLKNLPTVIKAPQIDGAWKKYNDFLKKYGSHILTTIHSGSLMNNWTISESSEEYSQSQFEMKVCADLQTDAMNLTVNCGRFNKDQLQKASHFEMKKSLTLLGGSPSTKAKLHQHFTSDLLKQFMLEAKTSPGPVAHEFKPIWEVLRENLLTNNNEDENTRLLNLEQYYEGMLDFGCSCRSEENVLLRKFVLDNDDKTNPSYSCRIPPLGCSHSNGCHFSWGSCYCHGKSCIDGTDITKIFHTKKSSRFIRWEKFGSSNTGINKGCQLTLKGCKCNNAKTYWKPIWPPPDRFARRSLAANEKRALDIKITFSSSGKTSPSKNTIIEAITGVFISYIFDLISVRVENTTNSDQISVRVTFGTNMLIETIPEKDFRTASKSKISPLRGLEINQDTINVEYFGVQLSGWTEQAGTCADGTKLKTRQCTEKELKCNGVTKDNCVDYYVPSNKEPIPTEPPAQGPTVTPPPPQCDPCKCQKSPKPSSGVTHTVFNFLFTAPLILLAWFRG